MTLFVWSSVTLSASHMKGYIITTEVLPFKAAEDK